MCMWVGEFSKMAVSQLIVCFLSLRAVLLLSGLEIESSQAHVVYVCLCLCVCVRVCVCVWGGGGVGVY